MESELVENAITAFAGVGVRTAGHGVDVPLVGESQHIRRVAVVINQVSTQIQSAQVEGLGELLAIVDEKFGLQFVAGGNPGIVAGLTATLAQDEAAGCCPGPADLPGLLRDFEAGVSYYPFWFGGEREPLGGG